MPVTVEQIIAYILKDDVPPLSYRFHEDQSLVVIAGNGMKFTFSPDLVQRARVALTPKPGEPKSKRPSVKPAVKQEPAPKKDPPPKIASKKPSKPPNSDS